MGCNTSKDFSKPCCFYKAHDFCACRWYSATHDLTVKIFSSLSLSLSRYPIVSIVSHACLRVLQFLRPSLLHPLLLLLLQPRIKSRGCPVLPTTWKMQFYNDTNGIQTIHPAVTTLYSLRSPIFVPHATCGCVRYSSFYRMIISFQINAHSSLSVEKHFSARIL